jgi:hypothetical protein
VDIIQDELDRLAQSGPLTVAQALELANKVADQVKQAAAPLEESGDFEWAAHLYEQAARAFELAAENVPSAGREQVTASGEFWSVKADVTRYRVYTASPISPAEQGAGPAAGPPRPDVQHPSAPPVARPSKPPTGPLAKPIETQDESWTVTPPASSGSGLALLPTAMKKPGGARDGQWSVAQVRPPVDESGTPGAVLKKLDKARKKPADEEHESPYNRSADQRAKDS